ncbi:hypothetical protein C8R44DRAFT_981014 [Mycena epipterygia]|nr:hypothetical protein C8R44DRAFT_981014 [Mycena epipterygia]
MPVGEVPITSYFSRVPQKKRKENPHTTSAPAKRKRLHADSDQEDAPAPKKDLKMQAALSFPKASRKTVPVRTRSGTSHSDTPATPDSESHSRNLRFNRPAISPDPPTSEPSPLTVRRFSSFPASPHAPSRPITPPALTRVRSKGKSVAFATPSSLLATKSPKNNHADLTNIAHWDDPEYDIVPSSQSQYITSPNLITSSPPLPEPFMPSAPSSQPDTSDPVPSSQSQYMLPSHPSPQRWNECSSIDFVPSSQSQYITPTPVPDVQWDVDGFVVPSSQSQSQCLPPVHLNGEDDALSHVTTNAIDDETIPSSQSQFELELTPWPNGGSSHDHASGGEPTSPFLAVQSQDVAIQSDLDFDDMFEGPFTALEGSAVADLKDNSATESDDDVPILPRAELIRSSSPVPEEYSLQSGFASVQSIPDDGYSAASSSSSAESLPAAVKNFYDMLEGDGSYPDDFPASLKWNSGGDTQEE